MTPIERYIHLRMEFAAIHVYDSNPIPIEGLTINFHLLYEESSQLDDEMKELGIFSIIEFNSGLIKFKFKKKKEALNFLKRWKGFDIEMVRMLIKREESKLIYEY